MTVALVTLAAWAIASTSAPGVQASGNQNDVAVAIGDVSHTGRHLYPTGTAIRVLWGNIRNEGMPGQAPSVKIASGSVSKITSNGAACTAFIQTTVDGVAGVNGLVVVTDARPVPPGAEGDIWTVSLIMRPDAPDACRSKAISFTVTLTVTVVNG